MPGVVGPAFIRHEIAVAAPTGTFLGTDARVLLDSFKPGYQGIVERLRFTTGPVAGAGAGGTQTFVLRKGGVAGTALATLVVALADTSVGKYLETAVAAADDQAARFSDTDTLSLTRTVSGTAYTTEPAGTFHISVREQPQKRI